MVHSFGEKFSKMSSLTKVLFQPIFKVQTAQCHWIFLSELCFITLKSKYPFLLLLKEEMIHPMVLVSVLIVVLSCVPLFATPWSAALQAFCPSLSSWVCSNSCPLSQWCHSAISFSISPFSSFPQSFPASGSFPMWWFFVSGGQSIGASALASVLPWIFRFDFLYDWLV